MHTPAVVVRALAVLGVLALALAGAPAAGAQDGPQVVRLAGETRIETAAAVAAQVLADVPASTRIVVDLVQDRGAEPDAWQVPLVVASWTAGAAAAFGPSVLLPVPADGTLPEPYAALLRDRAEGVSPTVVGDAAFVERVQGQVAALTDGRTDGFGYAITDIEQDSAMFATDVAESAQARPRVAMLATTATFADALAAGPLAPQAGLLVLTRPDRLNPAFEQRLATFDRVTIVGGTDAVPEAFADRIRAEGVEVVRLAGSNRFLTALEVARALRGGPQPAFDGADLGLARADVPVDALAAAAHAVRDGSPILLTPLEALPVDYGSDALTPIAGCGGRTFVYGGELAVGPAPVDALGAARCP